MARGENGRAEEEKEVRAPLLAAARRVPRKNSVNSMRGEFVARLPEKVKRGVDPESPFTIDVSRTRDLLEGSRREKEYYEKQFATLRSFEEVDSLNTPNVIDEALDLEEQRQSEFAMKISNYANIALLALKYSSVHLQVDIELPEDLPLKEAHAIGESLQIKIEELPEVERAFVHLDFECDHKPEHSILVKLPSTQA
ncbi:hypothetical protein BHM03_00015554 [Ensete ventricosum]|nr:hypothetical protein BHM03_00015554 [Ensete ventricosum]